MFHHVHEISAIFECMRISFHWPFKTCINDSEHNVSTVFVNTELDNEAVNKHFGFPLISLFLLLCLTLTLATIFSIIYNKWLLQCSVLNLKFSAINIGSYLTGTLDILTTSKFSFQKKARNDYFGINWKHIALNILHFLLYTYLVEILNTFIHFLWHLYPIKYFMRP